MFRDIYSLAAGHLPAALVLFLLILSIVFDVSKIPINPWKRMQKLFKKFLSAIGDIQNRDLNEKVIDISKRLADIEKRQQEDAKQAKRRAILRFADECRLGVRHSKEMFNNVFTDIDSYEQLCKDTGDPNSVLEEAIDYIKEINHKCLKENSYL